MTTIAAVKGYKQHFIQRKGRRQHTGLQYVLRLILILSYMIK